MPTRHKEHAGGEDLNLWKIVGRQFDKAAATLDLPEGLLAQIKACNAVYYVQFPVRFTGGSIPWYFSRSSHHEAL